MWIVQITFLVLMLPAPCISAQQKTATENTLSPKEQSIVSIAALTAKGDVDKLKTALKTGLDAGLTISQIKEILIHLYAYCGFPRSIRGLQTFMQILDERKSKGVTDVLGAEASPINDNRSRYERGRENLEKLTGVKEAGTKAGYAAFAPEIEVFLKEHLFADLFERDVLTYAERQLVTISVLAGIGGAEPMLRSHLKNCLNVGLTPNQLQEFVVVIKSAIGEKEVKSVQIVLNDVLTANRS